MTLLWPEEPRLVAVYDVECAGRWDHDFYLSMADELSAETVIDIGCGTGVFVADVAQRGMSAIGIDPAEAILDLARRRVADAGLEQKVQLVHGDLSVVDDDVADLVIMMGHVAQYFLTDSEWQMVLTEAHRVLRPGGHLAFETRNPAVNWAAEWTEDNTRADVPHPDGGDFTSWVQVVDVAGPVDSYVITHHGHTILPSGDGDGDGVHLVAEERLRFRNRDEVVSSLEAAGFAVERTWADWERSAWTPESREIIVDARAL